MATLRKAKVMGLILAFWATPATLWPQQHSATAAMANFSSSPADSGSRPTDDRPALQQRNPRYQVQRDDILLISFALSSELNQTVTVQPDGYISLQGVGSLHVQGLTVPEVVETLKKAYSKTLHDPIIDVDLEDFQKAYFVALGQVGKPGKYDLREDMTVTEAIGVAGGFTAGAKTQAFLYHRVSNEWAEVKELKLKDFLHGKNISEDAHLTPGDMIFVPEKAITKFRKYVPYSLGTGIYPQAPVF
jgi:polysaccharide export outer membrane protein